jgi:hypothetical protein
MVGGGRRGAGKANRLWQTWGLAKDRHQLGFAADLKCHMLSRATGCPALTMATQYQTLAPHLCCHLLCITVC